MVCSSLTNTRRMNGLSSRRYVPNEERQASESQPLLSPQLVDLTPQRQVVYSEGAQWV